MAGRRPQSRRSHINRSRMMVLVLLVGKLFSSFLLESANKKAATQTKTRHERDTHRTREWRRTSAKICRRRLGERPFPPTEIPPWVRQKTSWCWSRPITTTTPPPAASSCGDDVYCFVGFLWLRKSCCRDQKIDETILVLKGGVGGGNSSSSQRETYKTGALVRRS